MENKNNYAVDLGESGEIRSDLIKFLAKVADRYNWKRLGWVESKKYFRFGYADENCDAGEGFYYWTADFMKDKDYAFVTIDKAIQLLSTIDKTIISDEVKVGAIVVKIGNDYSFVGCRKTLTSHLSDLHRIMYVNDLKFISLDTLDDKNITFTRKQLEAINKIIEQKKKG